MGIHIGRRNIFLVVTVCIGVGSNLALAAGIAEPLSNSSDLLAKVAPMQSPNLAGAALVLGSDGAVLPSPNSAEEAYSVRLVRAVPKTSQNSAVLSSRSTESQGNSADSQAKVAPMQSSNLASGAIVAGSAGAVYQCQSSTEEAHVVRFVRAVPKMSQNSAVLSSQRLN